MKENFIMSLLEIKNKFLELRKQKLKYATLNKKLIELYNHYLNVIECFEHTLNNYFNDGLNFNKTNYSYCLTIFEDIFKYGAEYDKNYLNTQIVTLREQFSDFLHDIYMQKILNECNIEKNKQCFAPYDILYECTKRMDGDNIRLAHTISNANNFKKIDRAFPGNKFYSFNTNPRDKEIHFISDFQDKRKKENSAEYIFCHHHDPIIFEDIEIKEKNIDTNNERHHFLQNYRIFYKRHSEEKAIIDSGTQNKYIHEIEKIWNTKPYSLLFSKEAIKVFIEKEKEKQLYKEKSIIEYDKDTLADGCFRRNKKHKTIYLVFKLKGYTKVLSSTCGMAKYINNNIPNDTEIIFFHVLQNRDNPCIIFSGFESQHMLETLSIIEKLYDKSEHEFIEFVASYLCISDNSFFTTSFVNNLSLKQKFEDYYNNDNKMLSKYKDSIQIFNHRNFIKNRISLTLEESSFLFNIFPPFKNF